MPRGEGPRAGRRSGSLKGGVAQLRIWPREVPGLGDCGEGAKISPGFPLESLSLGPGDDGQVPEKNEGFSEVGMGSERRVSGRWAGGELQTESPSGDALGKVILEDESNPP